MTGASNQNAASGLDIAKPWILLTADAIDALPAQLGVYQIADEAGVVAKIGYAGGTTAFGMRTVLVAELEAKTGTHFRYQFTHGYLTRWEELLMEHHGLHGELPPGNADHDRPLGRLSVLGAAAPAEES